VPVAMAKKRKPGAGRPPVPNPKKSIVSLKATPEFAAWFEELTEYLRIPASIAIEHGLICLAKERGFSKPAPPR
jgi:hypothetical protein